MESATQILEYFGFISKIEEPTYGKNLLHMAKDTFKSVIFSTSWFLYVTVLLLIACYLYICYIRRNNNRANNQRIRMIQRIIDRVPPKRRPGAVVREREIFRKVMGTAYSYIYPNNERTKCVVRQTRSGTVYGKFLPDENSVEK